MKHVYFSDQRGLRAGLLTPGLCLLVWLILLCQAAWAQFPAVTVTPAGPLTLCAGGTQTLTATATATAGTGVNGVVNTLAVQPDGKVLVAGNFTAYNGNAAAPDRLLRLNADGTLDNTFNPGGAGPNSSVLALAVQPDGKVLVGGGFSAYNGDAAAPNGLLRLNADGSLDTSFNPGGAGTNESVLALALQPDGKVLVGGFVFSYNNTALGSLLRVNADGSVDTGFNPGGTGISGIVYTLALQADGKVLVGGSFTSYNANFNAPDNLLRLTAGGGLDNTFNPGGAGFDGIVNALAVQPDGKVLVGGGFSTYNGDAAAPNQVLRLTAGGGLDNTFNPGGAGIEGSVSELAVQADGRVLVGGGFLRYNDDAAAPDNVLRLTAAGSLDITFNAGSSGPNSSVDALAVQADGKVLIGGRFTSYNGDAAAPDYVLRLNANGSLDNGVLVGLSYAWSNGATGASITVSQPGLYQATATTSNSGTGYSNVVRVNAPPSVTVRVTPAGPLTLPSGGSATLTATAAVPGFNVAGSGFNGVVNALAAQADGKVLVGGSFTSYNNFDVPDNLLRLNADGTLDPTFNPGGGGPNGAVLALALQPDGKLLIGGSFTQYNGNASAPDRLLRLNADGTLDPAFNAGGSGAAAPGVSGSAVFTLALRPDGKVLVGGNFTGYNGASATRLLRLNADGTPDNTFNPGGSGPNSTVHVLALRPDGKVLAGGDFTGYNDNALAPNYLLRLNADGTPDPTFNPGGSGPNGAVVALTLQPDGKALVGGDFTGYNNNALAPDRLLRLNADGARDLAFNPGGSGPNDVALGMVVQPDGKVLVGGRFTQYNGASANHLLRLSADGTPDNTFNPGGSGPNDDVLTLVPQSGNGVLVGGSFTSYNGTAAAPDQLVQLRTDGALNDTDLALPGATFVFNPDATSGSTRTVSTAGSYTATATDPATGCTYVSNTVEVTRAPLPVELVGFTATWAPPVAVRLAWTTAQEQHSAYFAVERSPDGLTFAGVGTVAAAGNSSNARTYRFRDEQLPTGAALLYYRLRQVDQDGTFAYSPVRTVTLSEAGAKLSLTPNPTRAATTLRGAAPGAAVQVYDVRGRLLLTATADATGTAQLQLPAQVPTGVYLVRSGARATRLLVQ